MNGFMKNLLLISLSAFTLYSCVPAEVSTSASCGTDEAYDSVERECYSTILPLRPPRPTLNNATLTEDGLPLSVSLTYTDVDDDQANLCAVFNFAEGIDDTVSSCVCSGGICRTILTPDPDFSGYTEFYYTLSDTNGVSSAKAVSVFVTPVNDAPLALDASFTVLEGVSPVSMDISGLASDPDFDNIYFVKLTDPSDGSIVAFDGVNGTFSYLPPVDNYGVYTFIYKVCDYGSPTLCSDNKTVTITVTPVDDPPVVTDISISKTEDTSIVIDLPHEDVEGDLATACNIPSSSNMTLISCLCPGGFCQATLTPDLDFNSDLGGSVIFTYNVVANTLTSDPSTVTISITAVNDNPTFSYTPGTIGNMVPEDTTVILASAEDLSKNQFDIGISADEGGGIYEDSQTLFLNIQWANISAPSATIIHNVDVYYDTTKVGTFTSGTTSSYVNIADSGGFDASLLKLHVVPTVNESGKVGISMRIKDSAGSPVVDPFLTTIIEYITTNDPPIIQDIGNLVINEADIRFTDGITITEAISGSELSDNIWVAYDSSNPSLLPVTTSNISAYSQYINTGLGITENKVLLASLAGCDGRVWHEVE
ncbi:MAG: tandem-95 repeat protein, partial [Bacteriovoracaceae bacterium]|nr:tandem-95 repeat protein [Bacteriovoracaceae bacterium]